MECEGCTVRDVCKVSAKIAKKGNLECPCAICLLKGICVDACVDYYEFRIKYRRYKEESYSKNSSKKMKILIAGAVHNNLNEVKKQWK